MFLKIGNQSIVHQVTANKRAYRHEVQNGCLYETGSGVSGYKFRCLMELKSTCFLIKPGLMQRF